MQHLFAFAGKVQKAFRPAAPRSPSLDELPDDGVVLPSVVTHADLASLSGGSRENVTRILSEFQRRDLVTRDDRRYVLKNIKGLCRLAGL